MKISHILKLFLVAIVYMAINVAVSFLVVAIYSYLIHTGEAAEFYQAFAERSAPYSSIFAGMPLLFLLCWWFTRGYHWAFAIKSTLGIWLIYFLIDLAVLLYVGMTSRIAIFLLISAVTKLIAAWYGAKWGSRNAEVAVKPRPILSSK